MKDARGHGSNKRTSNADAANALASALKSTQAPVHDAMVGQHVQDAFRNAAAYGPEHESVGQSLRNAAALERDNAAHGGGSWVPRDVADRFKREAREKKQFASGQREINRLKKQGK